MQQEGGAKVHELSAYVARDRDKYERELVHSRKRLQELVVETSHVESTAEAGTTVCASFYRAKGTLGH